MMKEKKCIFDDNKSCDDCGKCDICDLDPNKICNNCGKCLEEEGIDTKAIKIDEIIEDEKYADKIQHEETNMGEDHDGDCSDDEYSEDDCSDDEYLDDDYSTEEHDPNYNNEDYVDVMDMNVEFIDDINGLGEVLEDNTKSDSLFEEQFPGLIKLKPSKYKN